ncbi:acyl-CoA dehydrogenase family protein [Pyruvatibacter mobilis]|jgi:alkylation response protein AidB-like acyl-CoA dehydrogenase|uniref:Acyl-CoA dehydrogenase n=1 Tax=Pyruvatibacter mobilis TaxID=1712261 RepID=A0A845QEL0_9HYPH|nr:acyl-CoA dehydrogenase family protein [Pyruvatibacter mobilis]NBG97115.1 acyl-CoA dehydrogenase [Pyruvatibacter mobilis]QJD74370.1 acyl-CoA dehydrogenase [Pyruvatibacter mobilis]GGD06383.1 acyl-CoA dehydrogenase [Pyruvatibacter mobilis]
MGFVLTEEQQILRDSAKGFIAEKSPVTELRRLRDSNDENGFDTGLWSQMAEMGFAGIIIPEEYGGAGFGYRGLGLVLEEAGRTLAASPLVSTSLLCASALLIGGSEDQKKALLPEIASGNLVMALAMDEGAHHNPANIEASAAKDGDGYVLNGTKSFVLDGHVAGKLIVAARTSGARGNTSGLTLFIVDGDAAGVTRKRHIMVDSRNAAEITLKDVKVAAGDVLGRADNGFEILSETLDRARIGLAAEMLGSLQEAYERTIEYLKERKQFGVVIGSFQGLKHRAAKMFCDIELCKSVVADALDAIDERRNDIAQAASLAKARVGAAFNEISSEAVQMHGGIGVTDEYEIGFFLKRARVADATFGNVAFHSQRYAELEGY